MLKLKSVFGSAILYTALALSGGCATVQIGHDFDPVKFDTWVKKGETTQADVQQFLGAPTSTGAVVEHDGARYQRWLYYYGKSKVHKLGEAKLKMLEVRFDMQQKVDSYNWSAE